jgi:hypothetical protein
MLLREKVYLQNKVVSAIDRITNLSLPTGEIHRETKGFCWATELFEHTIKHTPRVVFTLKSLRNLKIGSSMLKGLGDVSHPHQSPKPCLSLHTQLSNGGSILLISSQCVHSKQY